MKYFIPVIFRFLYAVVISIMMIVMFCVGQIAYTLWTFKFKSFNKEWSGGRNFWEYDANGSFEEDPKKIYPSVWHWVAAALPQKPKVNDIIIEKDPFLNNK